MIYACERVHDVERAAQWCETVRDFCEEWSVPQLFASAACITPPC
jgi:hypothetical protein